MRELCQTHCPPRRPALGGVVAAVIVAVIGWAVAQAVASLAAAVMLAGFAVLGVSVAAGAVVVYRACRQVPFGAEPACAARALPATPVHAALPVRQRAAIEAARVHVITDAAESRVVARKRS